VKTIIISSANPLDKQCKELTGDGWNSHDWEEIAGLTPEDDLVKHKKTGLILNIQIDRTPPEPAQEEDADIYQLFDQLAADLRTNDRQWREINAASYKEMLECLPPLAMSSIGFLGSEPYTHLPTGEAVYISCIESGSKFFAAYLTRKEFKTTSPAGIPKHGN